MPPKPTQKVTASMKPGTTLESGIVDLQVEVPKIQLTEEINRILQATNPNAPQQLIRYNYQQKQFKMDPNAGATHFHVEIDGSYVFNDENYYNAFEDNQEKLLFNQFNFSNRGTQTFNVPPRIMNIQTQQFEVGFTKGQLSKSIIYDLYKVDKKKNVVQEDAALVANTQNPFEFAGHEGYVEPKIAESATTVKTEDNKISALSTLPDESIKKIVTSLNLSEKLIAQSAFSEVVTDFAAWNDPADQYKPQEGSLYPLWKFSQSTSIPVSGIVWHPKYKDVFAVSYGVNQPTSTTFTPGLVCIFSLKNPFYSEKQIKTHCDVICTSWNEDDENLLLVGLVDGNVQIWDLENTPACVAQSSTHTKKHLTAVTGVKWRKDSDKELGLQQFLSVSSDGQVFAWAFVQGDLRVVFQVTITDSGFANDVGVVNKVKKQSVSNVSQQNQKSQLQSDATILIAPKQDSNEQHDSAFTPVTGLTSIKLNWEQPWLYTIGTETGMLRICSTAYLTNFIQSFNLQSNGHSMPITEITWNKYRSDLVATSSEDYLIKIWQMQRPTPIFTYDLQAPVVACQFSRDVSSVLVAATSANTIHIFDFDQKKESEVCVQVVVPDDARLTKMCMNDYYPVIAVGDNKGVVRVFKLSPNLRKRSVYMPIKSKTGIVQQFTPEQIKETEMEMEMKKLEDYINWCEKCNAASGVE
ncbi:Dynein intermediate chain [Spironucleus salmonicida]|uniref:Dynein intermediate chain n=1 Tax=Spironucleus salmonicida TaxID=348837 RepID=V6LYL8_9EUKA|nr:Dynein intermediate chain [Spironucleus salmonicida]|eukprot:EST49353.1 Dynein intermediate chain [Spironucleus salmonicida]